jgi:hypothetical protein
MSIVTAISISSNILTVQCVNTFAPGQAVIFTGLNPSTFLNGQAVTILTSSGTQFTASFTHADLASTPQSAGDVERYAYILAAKELNGGIYLTRLPKAIVNPDGSVSPGIPDNWYFVGPGTNPNIQEYNGTKFVLTFTYLSHMNVRIVDIATWPPTEVVPITNPPTITIGSNTTGSGAPQDSLTLKTESSATQSLVQQFFKPPALQTPLLFLDPTTATYSVTISPISTWFPDPPAGILVYYRFYARPFPYTGNWVLVQDWTLENYVFGTPTQPLFSFLFQSVGSLRYQFSVTWGTQFNLTDQWNPNAHMEGIPGASFVTVDSTTQRANAQAFINEHLTQDFDSDVSFGIFGPRQAFLVEAPSDHLAFGQHAGTGFSVPLVGDAVFFTMLGNHVGFITLANQSDTLDFSALSGISQPNAYQQGSTLQAVMG